MINYSIIINDTEYDLPEYNLDIAEKLENVDRTNASSRSLRDKCNGIYTLITQLLGEETTKEIVGDFSKVDPNNLNIIYLRIVDAYNNPLNNFETERRAQTLDDAGFTKIMGVMETLSKLDLDKLNRFTK